MIEIEELISLMNSYEDKVLDLKETIKYDDLKEKLKKLEYKTTSPTFWNDSDKSQEILKLIKSINGQINIYDDVEKQYTDIQEFLEIAILEEDSSCYQEMKDKIKVFQNSLDSAMLSTLLTGEFDDRNAIINFHAGAGGIEAQDWLEMLYRMYTRWADDHKYKCKVLEYVRADEAGIKMASILISGENAYGFLKSEAGVHRLIRISPFDSSGKRHTSFAAIEILPEIDDDNTVKINDEDLRIDKYRSGGAGGQHVNKTESAVRLTHIPTGVVVSCQSQRSQHQNLEVAMKLLRSKLVEIKEREHLDRIEDIKGDQKEIGWGSQIRSYVFMPYTMVKDHRTNYETGDISSVMDGDIDDFIKAYLKYINE